MFDQNKTNDRVIFYLLGCAAVWCAMTLGIAAGITAGLFAALVDFCKD